METYDADTHLITDSTTLSLVQLTRRYKGEYPAQLVYDVFNCILSTLVICMERKREVAIKELGHFRLMRSKRKLSRLSVVLEDKSIEHEVRDFKVRLEWIPTSEIQALRKGLTQWQKLDEPATTPVATIDTEIWSKPPRGMDGRTFLLRSTKHSNFKHNPRTQAIRKALLPTATE